MKILVLAEHYVKERNYSLLYVHTRNLEYKKSGHDVTVINFREKESYTIDGVQVYGPKAFNEAFSIQDFDLVVSHAPNIKNHFRFLLPNVHKIKKLIFFIHGHEVLLKDKYYPKPFSFQKQRRLKRAIHYAYDRIKVRLFKIFLSFLIKRTKVHLVFVSKWMEDEFYKCINMEQKTLIKRSSIIHNPVNSNFINNQYSPTDEFDGDFITIRPFDGPKYCVDLVRRLALSNPKLKFSLYGEGDFFEHFNAPGNLTIHKGFLKHSEIPKVLNKHKAALMLTRLDAQGVMACEMAVYGIPLVTSDIPLKRQLLSDAENVSFLPNDLSKSLSDLEIHQGDHSKIIKRFSNEETLQQELKLFKEL